MIRNESNISTLMIYSVQCCTAATFN